LSERDYSWDKEEWEDLWLDLLAIDAEGDHYMGYVVLQETKESKKFLIKVDNSALLPSVF